MLPAMWDSGELDGLTVSLHTFRAPSVHVTDFSKIDWRNFFQFCDSSWALDGSGSEYKANPQGVILRFGLERSFACIYWNWS
jgi:hypothetical protein